MDKDLLHDAVQLASSHLIVNSIAINGSGKMSTIIDEKVMIGLVEKYYNELEKLSSK